LIKRFVVFAMSVLIFITLSAEVVRAIVKLDDTFTKEHFILQQLTFTAGSKIGYKDVKESILNLKKLDILGEVDIFVEKIDSGSVLEISSEGLFMENMDDTVDVYLITKEMLALLPSVGLEINSSGQFAITAGASFNNLWGIRHKIEGVATFGFIKEFWLEYSVPAVYSRKFSSRFKAAINSKNKAYAGFTEYHKLILAGLGYSFSPKVLTIVSLGYDRISLDQDSLLINPSDMYDEYGVMEVRLTADFRDDPYYPENGIFTELTYTHNYNTWTQSINRYLLTVDSRVLKKVPGGVLAMRNLFNIQDGTLAYYNTLQLDNLENRAVPDGNILGYNRYTGNLEYRYTFPFKFRYDLPVLGALSINFMTLAFVDWTYTNNDLSSYKPYDYKTYFYGVGTGFRTYSELYNAIGVDIGYDMTSTQTGFFNRLKYNFIIATWNF